MKNCFLLFTFLIFFNVGFAQSYEKGKLFIKVKDSYNIPLEFTGNRFLHSFPNSNTLEKTLNSQKVRAIVSTFRIKKGDLNKVYTIEYDPALLPQSLINLLKSIPFIEYVEQIPVFSVSAIPNDVHASQWYLQHVKAQEGWQLSGGSSNVVVAVVDDAVDLTHEDLKENIWVNSKEIAGNNIDDDKNGYVDDVNGWDAADVDNDPNPPVTADENNFSHGTHCAGIVAAVSNNGIGIASISGHAKIMAVKTKKSSTTGLSVDAAIQGIEYAIAAGADIISMSFGGYGESKTLKRVIDLASQNGIILIAAAGNNNTDLPHFPSAYEDVISVGAIDQSNKKASFSNYGSTIDILAPGVDIYNTVYHSAYGSKSGTSMACPMVSSLAALLLSRNQALTPTQVRACILNNATSVDQLNPGYEGKLGAGCINVYSTLTCARPITANFKTDFTTICPGQSRTFLDLSNNNPKSWKWEFEGGTPSTSTIQNPIVKYTTSGSYNVKLIVSNAEGSDTIVKLDYIKVESPTAVLSGIHEIYSGYNAYLEINFSGTPPFNFTYSNGSVNTTVSGITSSNYFFPVKPTVNTNYTLVNASDKDCSALISGAASVKVNNSPLPCYNVISHTLISSTSPNFSGQLEDNNRFGESIENIGDLDGDNIPEVAVASIHNSTTGAVWILFLNADGSVRKFNKISGVKDFSFMFGSGIAALGDLDKDGIPDIAIADNLYWNYSGGPRGAVHVLFLNKDGSVKNSNVISSADEGFVYPADPELDFIKLGQSVSCLGDLDNDGINDIVVAGEVVAKHFAYILYLNRNGSVKKYQLVDNASANINLNIENSSSFGMSVEGIGDLDKDGIPDMAFGTPDDYEAGNGAGAVYLALLKRDGTIKKSYKINALKGNLNTSTVGSNFGFAMSSDGDIDGDGTDDLLVSMYRDGNYKGSLMVLLLNQDGTVKKKQKIGYNSGNFQAPLVMYDNFGLGLSYLGDINKDGGPDFAAGYPGNKDGGNGRGAVFIVNLQPNCPDFCSGLKASFETSNVCIGQETSFKDISVDLKNTITSRTWYFGDGQKLSGLDVAKHIYASPGDYQVKLVIENDNSPVCKDSITKVIHVSNDLDFLLSADKVKVCKGDSVHLNVSGIVCGQAPFSYKWGNDNASPSDEITFRPLTDQSYQVSVKDYFGSEKTKTIAVSVDQTCCSTQAGIQSDKSYYCKGDSVLFANTSYVTGTASYKWTFLGAENLTSYSGITPSKVFYKNPGAYIARLIVEDQCGKDTVYKEVRVLEKPVSDIQRNVEVCKLNYTSIGASGISTYTYKWNPVTGLSDPQSGRTDVFVENDIDYTLTITDEITGCITVDKISIKAKDCDPASIKGNTNTTVISVFPNPFVDQLTIDLGKESYPIQASLLNTKGQLIKNVTLTGKENELELSELNSGVYYLNINNRVYMVSKIK